LLKIDSRVVVEPVIGVTPFVTPFVTIGAAVDVTIGPDVAAVAVLPLQGPSSFVRRFLSAHWALAK
jgi:hypothetical protein